MPTPDAAVALQAISKRYGDFVAVAELSLQVRRGALFGLLGPNGAGKSTTLRMINDILQPDSGTITLFGSLRPGSAASRRIGYLPEERGLYPKMTVGDTLRFFGEIRGVPGNEATRRADRWLERLQLAAWKTHKVQDLSKGMQQKVQFITAVIHEPDLLILDEPWSGLDPINADVLLDIVQEQKVAGRTVLFSTHQMDQAERLCDEVCIISHGRAVLDGVVAEVKRAAAGDRTLAIAFAAPDDERRAAALLADESKVAARRRQRGHLEVDLHAGVSAQELLKELLAGGVGLRRFELIEPTLHQIFVDRVRAAEVAHG